MITLPAYNEDDQRTLRSHLSLLHGVHVGDIPNAAGLVEAHEASHSDPDPQYVMKHNHNAPPDVVELEEWVW